MSDVTAINQLVNKITQKTSKYKVKQTFSQSLFSVTESLSEIDVLA